MTRERVSVAIAVLGAAFLGGRGLWVYLQDASYFLDAASIVVSLEKLSLAETFSGPLDTGHSFPRAYLAFIRGMRAVFGPETWATRLLPHAAYLAATGLWLRLFAVRFGRQPLLVALGVVLLALTPGWWTYSAVVKQYSLDVLLSVALLSLPESFLHASLGERRRGWRIPLLVLPVLFSYPYGIVLLARVLGWAFFGWRRGRLPDPVASAAFGAALVLAMLLLWATDLRHTLSQPALVRVWENCVAARQPPSVWPELLRRFLASWYVGPTEFIFPPKLARPAMWVLLAAQALGTVRILQRAVVPAGDDEAWGSRSLACVVAAGGAIASSFVVSSPMCAGRTLLYLLPLQQIVLLEGLRFAVERAESLGAGGWARAARALLVLGLVVLIGAAGVRAWDLHILLTAKLPLENFRPLIERVREEPDLPVLVTFCAERQMRTLPEGLEGLNVIWLPPEDWHGLVPREQELWIVHSRLSPGPCERMRIQLRSMTHGFDRPEVPNETAVVYRATSKSQAEIRKSRKRAYRMLRKAARAAEMKKEEAAPRP